MNKLVLLLSSFMATFGFAQELDHEGCTTHSLSKEILENNPEQKAQFDAFEAGFTQYQAQKSASRAQQSPNKKIIPVVVHVFHGNDNNNITDEHIQGAIDQATKDFMLTNADTVNVIDMFKPIIGKMNVEFRLAKIDPDGNCTEGITRHYNPYLTHNGGEPMKDVVKWDVKKYLNVWVGSSLTSGAGGYSFLPYTAPNGDQDAGIVIRNLQFGSVDNLGLFSGRSFTHEIGHYLGLGHTWGSTNTPGLASNCNTDDGIQDTPNTDGASNCNNMFYVGCPPDTANIQNIMCYSGCARMFTKGQVEKVQYYLDTYGTGNAPRRNLWQDANLIATGTNDGYVAQECAPTPLFSADLTEICAGESVQFSNESYGQTATSFAWEFQGAVTTTSTDENPTVQYNTPGEYKVKFTATVGSSNKTIERESYIKVLNPEAKHVGALVQSFESDFVLDDFANNSSWYQVTEGTTSSSIWKKSSDGFSHGSSSMRTRTRNSKSPIDISLITRAIDKSQMTNKLYLNFKYAYKEMQDSDDELNIFVSTDCGSTWIKRKKVSSSSLPTTGGIQGASSYKPSASHWKSVNANLSTASILAADKILVKFVLTGSRGNYLYIDEVNISTGLSTSEVDYNSANISIYPNPVNSGATTNVNFNLVENSTYTVKVIDALGRTVQVLNGNGKEGENTLQLNENLNSGLYWIELSSSNTKMTKKFQVL